MRILQVENQILFNFRIGLREVKVSSVKQKYNTQLKILISSLKIYSLYALSHLLATVSEGWKKEVPSRKRNASRRKTGRHCIFPLPE